MVLSKKSLEKLRDLINEDTEYRSGPKLVSFFNELGFGDTYRNGFPSRWIYTDEKLAAINGKPELDACIKTVLSKMRALHQIALVAIIGISGCVTPEKPRDLTKVIPGYTPVPQELAETN